MRPNDVGIIGMEWYCPQNYVDQRVLEKEDNCEGKYTKGLGQEQMSFCDDREDIGSILLTVAHRLLAKYPEIKIEQIGRLEVGTESLIDKSKSIKTTIAGALGIKDAEGITSINACYGGTAAFFNSVAWIESSAWDGRYAMLLCGDIAVYEKGPARPSGGAGAFAALIGPNAVLVLEPLRSTCVLDVWDFYKPKHSEYALVDGKLSQACYLRSVDLCWHQLQQKLSQVQDHMNYFDFYAFHAPYNKLVQKGFGRLFLSSLSEFDGEEYEATLFDKTLDIELRQKSADAFTSKVLPSALLPKRIGNTYTASVFLGLCSLVPHLQPNQRILLFSYGSGSLASMYSLRVTTSIQDLASRLGDPRVRLDARTACSFDQFSNALLAREAIYGQCDISPSSSDLPSLSSGTFALAHIDEHYRRSYVRID